MLDHRWILDAISELNSEGTLASISEALSSLAAHLSLDRCILRNRIPGTDQFNVIVEYHAPGLIAIDELEPDMGSETSLHLVQQLLQDGRVCINDILASNDFSQADIDKAQAWGCRAFLFLPLRYQGAINGMIIAIQSNQARQWDDEDYYTVQLLGETALAVWLHNQSLQALSDSRQQYQWALQASSDAIWDWNLRSGYFYNSRRFYQMLGHPDPQDAPIDQATFLSWVHPDDHAQLLNIMHDTVEDNPQASFAEFRMLTFNQELIWILVRGTVVQRDQRNLPIRLVGTYSDITTFKKTLHHLELLHQNAERANLAKTEFLARMSHEVRTPLNAITGMLHLLEDTELSDLQRDKVHIMQSASKQLLGVLNDILDISRIESGKLEMESIPFSLEDVVQNAFMLFAPMAAEKQIDLGVCFATDVPVTVIGDPNRLSQVLNNLLSNALKFTRHGEVMLHVGCRPASTGQLMLDFSLSDTGVGMTESQIEQLFNPFVQAELRIAREYGGSGLGLSICKSLVELMGGHVLVHSQYGSGSVFRFTIRVDCEQDAKTIYALAEKPLINSVAVVCRNDKAAQNYRTLLAAFSLDANIMVLRHATALTELLAGLPDVELLLLDLVFDDRQVRQIQHFIRDCRQDMDVILLPMSLHDGIRQMLDECHYLHLLAKPLMPRHLLQFIQAEVDNTLPELPAFSLTQVQQQYLANMRVLLVEDNPVNQMITRGMLRKYSVELYTAEHGKAAVDDIYQRPAGFYQAILMDIEMPVMDGFQATRLIRQMDKAQSLPVIAMTANTLPADIRRCHDAGMNAHIAKPIDAVTLVMTLLQQAGMLNAGQQQ